ncbi:MAG: hypothetical protein IPP68_08925 [Elusimicrobia bacterium]|nr:hypothetical protein [Elusimicrobiota bacterium]
MSSCHDHDCPSSPLREDHIRVLKIVLAVNLAMLIEAAGGLFFRSVALLVTYGHA